MANPSGAADRSLLLERLARAVEGDRSATDRRGAALVLVDARRTPDRPADLGHGLGGDVLAEVVRRIGEVLRPGDIVAHLGGDELVVLCERLEQPDDAVVIANRLDDVLAVPVHTEHDDVQLDVWIGLTLLGGEPEDPDELLLGAERVLRGARAGGHGRWLVVDDALRARVRRRQELGESLRGARDRGELELHYQPVLDLRTGRVQSVEALVRWRHRGELVQPEDFVPVAEGSGLIVPIGTWVLEAAAAQVAAWQRRTGHESLGLAVNVSARQIEHPELAQVVAACTGGSGLRPGTLTLELTESHLLGDLEAAARRLEHLRALGARVAMDDFGTGYSSLTYLRRLPVDVVKLDRSFVQGVPDDPEDTAIVRCVLDLVTALGTTCVAEGIETEAQRDTLTAMGCDSGQGHLFSPPLRAEELERLLG